MFGSNWPTPGLESGPPPEIVISPEPLRDTDFMKKYVGAIVEREGEGTVSQEVSISRGDITEFGRKAYALASDQEEAGKTPAGRLLRLYLAAYLEGKFVDRSGKKYAKPSFFNEIGGSKPTIQIGNDAISGFAAVALEALTDAAFGTPVHFEGDPASPQWLTDGGEAPTFAKLLGVIEPIQTDPSQKGITKLEYGLIRYASNVAGTKSKILASLVFGLLSEAEIEFVLGAHFAFGDNDTLRILLETLFEVASRKVTEHLSYKGLSAFEYTESNGRITPVSGDDTPLGRVIALLLQEQELLATLVPADGE